MQKNKILVIIGVLMLLGSSVLAQKFSGGVKAALVISQVDGDNLSGYNKVGAMAGAFANFTFLNERLKLQLDLDYIQKGSRQPQTGDVPDSYKMSVQQVEVPVLLGVRLFSGFWLEVGPSFDITFKGKEYLNGIEAAGSATFKVFELEALAGVNYTFRNRMLLFVRFGYSITPLGYIGNPGKNVMQKMRSNMLQLGFAYQFK